MMFMGPELAAPDLMELLQLDEAGFKSRFAGTPILRTKRRGLLRNVCVALGNVGDQSALPANHGLTRMNTDFDLTQRHSARSRNRNGVQPSPAAVTCGERKVGG